MQPSASGWSSSIIPFAMVVVANGRLCRSITPRSRAGSARRIAEDPSSAIGRLAFAISACAVSSASSGAGACRAGEGIAGTSSRAGARATSSGRSRCTGPRGSVIAMRIAAATVAPTLPGSSRSVALVIGANSL